MWSNKNTTWKNGKITFVNIFWVTTLFFIAWLWCFLINAILSLNIFFKKCLKLCLWTERNYIKSWKNKKQTNLENVTNVRFSKKARLHICSKYMILRAYSPTHTFDPRKIIRTWNENTTMYAFKKNPKNPQLKAGGKPSTWFPPESLVELGNSFRIKLN